MTSPHILARIARRTLVACTLVACMLIVGMVAPASAWAVLDADQTRVVRFFRALDAIERDDASAFMRIDELAQITLDQDRTVDLFELRKTGPRQIETQLIARDVVLRRVGVQAGVCAATRYYAALTADAVETLRALRADARRLARAVPAGTAPALDAAMRTCSGDLCQYVFPADSDRTDTLFAGFPAQPLADHRAHAQVTAPSDSSAFGPEGEPEEEATSPGPSGEKAGQALLSSEDTGFCQQGVLVDPR